MKASGCTIIPAKSEHAIQSAVFVCELGANISTEIARKALHYYDTSTGIKKLFPEKHEGRGFSIALSPAGIGVQNASDVDAVTFRRVDPDGMIEIALALEKNLISFTCNRYSRWKIVSPEAFGLLMEFINFIFPKPGISTIGLQYVDEFFVAGELTAFRPSMLFSESGEFLPPHILGREGPWHNHSGWFGQNEGSDRILNNININVLPQGAKYVVQIISAHRCILSQPITSQTAAQGEVPARFELLHSRHKALLKKLLNDDAKRAIHLEGE